MDKATMERSMDKMYGKVATGKLPELNKENTWAFYAATAVYHLAQQGVNPDKAFDYVLERMVRSNANEDIAFQLTNPDAQIDPRLYTDSAIEHMVEHGIDKRGATALIRTYMRGTKTPVEMAKGLLELAQTPAVKELSDLIGSCTGKGIAHAPAHAPLVQAYEMTFDPEMSVGYVAKPEKTNPLGGSFFESYTNDQ